MPTSAMVLKSILRSSGHSMLTIEPRCETRTPYAAIRASRGPARKRATPRPFSVLGLLLLKRGWRGRLSCAIHKVEASLDRLVNDRMVARALDFHKLVIQFGLFRIGDEGMNTVD